MGAVNPTRTLPVVYINTQNKQAVNDTETQVPMTLYIDSVIPDYHPLGSAQAPIPGTIKGRGNWTWNGFDKKPYKIKFDTKHKVLGMPNNRHWCLMANTDDYLGFLKMPAGFFISKALGLRWTPRTRPVELVLNGQYMGLYFLTEHVRIASHRVHIHEQADNETHRDSISGGWLVEIDNYPSENNITFQEGNGQYVMVSLKEPESLSSQQRQYIENQIYSLNNARYPRSSPILPRAGDHGGLRIVSRQLFPVQRPRQPRCHRPVEIRPRLGLRQRLQPPSGDLDIQQSDVCAVLDWTTGTMARVPTGTPRTMVDILPYAER